MYTQFTDKLYDEVQGVKQPDFPADGSTADLTAPTGKSYKLIAIYPFASAKELDVVVKYQIADVSNTGQTFQENMAVVKALLFKFPGLREAFEGIVAPCLESPGTDPAPFLPIANTHTDPSVN